VEQQADVGIGDDRGQFRHGQAPVEHGRGGTGLQDAAETLDIAVRVPRQNADPARPDQSGGGERAGESVGGAVELPVAEAPVLAEERRLVRIPRGCGAECFVDRPVGRPGQGSVPRRSAR
jgi:hypothetical protein